ncbi:MAG TPA: hypothetical protein VIR57_00815, partial [Chloroflexota bacterium]
VIADGEGRDVVAGQRPGDVLQLDQLHLAEGSPPGAAMEHDERLSATALLVQVDGPPRLVGQDHVPEQLSQSRPSLRVVAIGHASPAPLY